MATPLYKKLKDKGYTTYAFPGAAEDISAAHQNPMTTINFSKFALLNLNLQKMDLTNPEQFNTESINTFADPNVVLVNSLRNYVANHEVALREAKQTNNSYFYDPNVLATTTERIFWKWLRKSGLIEFEPAVPNDDYIDGVDFAIDESLPDDYFKEYLWKERSTSEYTITHIYDTETVQFDDLVPKKLYRLTLGSTSSLKPGDTITITNKNSRNIGFTGEQTFKVVTVESESVQEKNNWIYILSLPALSYDAAAVATVKLNYNRVIQYIGEVASTANNQHENRAYTSVIAYVYDHAGQTPDVLFRIKSDRNYSAGLQIPILPSQDQPEIIGGELYDSPIVLNPENYPGDQYAIFDADQKYVNALGYPDRRRGDYFGVIENNRRIERVVSAPYTFPEFDGTNLDGLYVDFNTDHYSRMNIGKKMTNFDEFNTKGYSGEAPKDFEYNVILWYYEVNDATKGETTMNLYGMTFLNSAENNQIETEKKLVTNGKQDGVSYQYSLNLNFTIHNENYHDTYDPQKTYNLFSFDLYNEVLSQMLRTNEIYVALANDVTRFKTDLMNMKSMMYNQTDIREVKAKIVSLTDTLTLLKRHQLQDSESIKVRLDESSRPPMLYLDSVDSRYGDVLTLPSTSLYNKDTNLAVDTKIQVPTGKDFMLNIVNDDTNTTSVDRPLNIVLQRDLDYRQTCVVNLLSKEARTNKGVTLSINSALTQADSTTGYNLLGRTLALPVDKNLNASATLNGIPVRWNTIPVPIFPENVSIRKLSETYYVVLEVRAIVSKTFKTGDVLLLENFSLQYQNDTTTIKADISGQYEIVGDILQNKLVFIVEDENFKLLYDKVYTELGANSANEYVLTPDFFLQPVYFRYNNGYCVTITCIDRDTTLIKDKYLISINNL